MTAVESFRGCLLGGALGDALAYGMPADRGDDAPFDLARENPAPIGCATQLTLFVAEGLLRAHHRIQQKGIGHAPSMVEMALLRWYDTQGGVVHVPFDRGWLVDEPRLRARRMPDETCMAVLAAIAGRTQKPTPAGSGAGAVIRAAPCGLAARTPEIAFELARDIGALTHGPAACHAAGYFATVIWHLVRGTSLGDAMRTVEPHTDDTLAVAFACAGAADRGFEQALWRAAAHSTGAASITGNLLGAMGHALPAVWLQQLELADVIDRVATDLYVTMIAGRTAREYPPN